jgi:hypothetical protein
MERVMKTDTWLKIICAPIISSVLFGTGAVTVLSTPVLNAHAPYLIPAVVFLSLAISPFLAGYVGRRMRLQYWGAEAWKRGDFISG